MFLKDIAPIIYTKGTASENMPIKVIHATNKNVLWKGKAKDLEIYTSRFKKGGWIIEEILVDTSGEIPEGIPRYNLGKIITVI